MLTKRQIILATGYSVKDWPGACGVICNRIIDHELYEPEIAELWLDEETKNILIEDCKLNLLLRG